MQASHGRSDRPVRRRAPERGRARARGRAGAGRGEISHRSALFRIASGGRPPNGEQTPRARGDRWLRLHEKGGRRQDVPAHPTGRLRPSMSTSRRSGSRSRRWRCSRAWTHPGRRLTGPALPRRIVLAMDQAASGRRGAAAFDVLPHVPGDGDHGVSVERRDA